MNGLRCLFLTTTLTLLHCGSSLEARAQSDQPGTGQPGQRQRGGRPRPGNFDPAQFRQRMMDRYRERLEISDDAEWKVIQPLIQNVLDARLAAESGRRGGFGRGPRRTAETNPTAPTPPRPGPVRENPAAEELQKAIEAKAPAPEIKAALARYNEFRKAKQAELDKAREALRAVLTARQEAIASLSGLL